LGHPCEFQRVSRLGSITARNFSSKRQPNFAAVNRGRHLYSAGRPSRWALARILVNYVFNVFNFYSDFWHLFTCGRRCSLQDALFGRLERIPGQRNNGCITSASYVGDTAAESFAEIFGIRKLDSLWGNWVWRCLRDRTFSQFSRAPTCDRQTDRQTGRHTRTACTALAWRRAVTICEAAYSL